MMTPPRTAADAGRVPLPVHREGEAALRGADAAQLEAAKEVIASSAR